MIRILFAAIALAITLAAADQVHAGSPPPTMSFSARLLDQGTAFDGEVTVQLDLYRSATPVADSGAIWTETYRVTAQDGLIAVRMGEQHPLTTTIFDGGDIYLEVTIARDGTPTVLEPRLAVGSVPYALRAGFAEETAAVPPGAVMSFDLAQCPPGWTELESARGRTIVGGAPGGLVGEPLGNLEDRGHAHTLPRADLTTGPAGGHSHAGASIAASPVPHTHPIPALSGSTSHNWHNHEWARYDDNQKQWFSFLSNGAGTMIVDWGNGLDDSRGGGFPLSAPTGELHTAMTGHNHTVNVGASHTEGAAAQQTSHTHTLSIPSDGSHHHSTELPERTSLAGRTSQVMPYIQLLVCRKS